MRPRLRVYLIDTNVISEARKKDKADSGVIRFFRQTQLREEPVYLSAITIGELRRGVELIRHRGDERQADLLERWLMDVVSDYRDHILGLDAEAAQVWGRLRVPHPENELDKQIAAIALIHDLTVVTRNAAHFKATGARVLSPFSAA